MMQIIRMLRQEVLVCSIGAQKLQWWLLVPEACRCSLGELLQNSAQCANRQLLRVHALHRLELGMAASSTALQRRTVGDHATQALQHLHKVKHVARASSRIGLQVAPNNA
jgi:hypothetical protein